MRILLLLTFVAVSACSSSHEQGNDAPDTENAIAPCVTEEMLREANASEAEIRQFRKEEAEANREASCG